MTLSQTYNTEAPPRGQLLWLAVYLVLSLVVFWPAREAGFVTDWLGGQEAYENGTYWQALNSFGWRALIPVLFVINFTLFKVFGTYWLPWFLIFTGAHALNAWQLHRLTLQLPGLQHRNTSTAAIAAALLFLLSPYAAEPVVWKGCIQYQLSLLCVLTALLHCLAFFRQPALRHVVWVSALFLAGIFMYGWNVITPLLITGFVVACTWALGDWSQLKQRLARLAAPQWLLLACWFGLNKFYLGQWVGHYGAGTHMHFDPKVMVATSMKYLVKYLFFVRYFEPADKSRVFDWFDRPAVAWGSLLALVILLGLWLIFFRKIHARLRWAGFAFWAFLVALIPVANLFFYYLQWSENDRYGYMGAAFLWLSFALLVSGLPRWLFALVCAVPLVVSVYYQRVMTRTWGEAEQVYSSLVQDFRWYDTDEVIILASPDNIKGVSILRIIGQQSGFDEALALRRRQPYTGKMWEVAQFNMETTADGVKVSADSSGMEYTVDFRQYGNWWFRNGVGAENYQTDRYLFRKNEWNVQTILKAPRTPRTAIIYPVGGKWEEVE